jgi:ribokinase
MLWLLLSCFGARALANQGSGHSQPALVVVGSINADLIAYSNEENRIGNYVFGERFSFNLGGKGLNQAVNAAASGVNTVLIGRVGDDVFGQKIISDLINFGVYTDQIKIDESAHTGIGHVRVSSSGEYDTVVVNGANSNLQFAEVDDAVKAVNTISFGLMNYEISSEVISDSAALIRSRGGSTIINFSPVVPGIRYVMSDADYLVANADEIRSLLGQDSNDIQALALAVQTSGAKNVIITLGEQGAYGLDEFGNSYTVKSESVEITNTIGAGDTFLAMLALALHSGSSFEHALSFANYLAALVCTKQESFLSGADVLQAIQKFDLKIQSSN